MLYIRGKDIYSYKIIKNIRTYHEFVDRKDNFVPSVTAWHHEALPCESQVMPISDLRDRVDYSIHKRMLNSFSCILWVPVL